MILHLITLRVPNISTQILFLMCIFIVRYLVFRVENPCLPVSMHKVVYLNFLYSYNLYILILYIKHTIVNIDNEVAFHLVLMEIFSYNHSLPCDNKCTVWYRDRVLNVLGTWIHDVLLQGSFNLLLWTSNRMHPELWPQNHKLRFGHTH